LSEGEKITKVLEQKQPYVSVTLKRQSKGYAWDIHVVADDEHEALYKIDVLNEELRRKYGQESEAQSKKPVWATIPTKKSQVEEDVLP